MIYLQCNKIIDLTFSATLDQRQSRFQTNSLSPFLLKSSILPVDLIQQSSHMGRVYTLVISE